jgi:hypothetical protein
MGSRAMTKLLALTSLILLGCSKTPTAREADCEKVLGVVEKAIEGVPARYRDAAIADRASSELKRIEYADAAIERVVLGASVTYDDIQQLCVHRASDHDRDCAFVRARLGWMRFDLALDRTRGAGIRDESGLAELENRAYAEPAVKEAVTALVRETGAAFYTPNDHTDAAANDQRARAAYGRLAVLCALSPLP